MHARQTAVAGFCCALLTSASVWAFRSGAPPGYSGGPGPANDPRPWNCTACHGFNEGSGGVELFGVPQRYRPGVIYDLVVRVRDDEQAGAGFQVSVEGPTTHAGQLIVSDGLRTQFPYGDVHYITHLSDGVDESVAEWPGNGGSFDYQCQWMAPHGDVGRVHIYAAGNAINNSTGNNGDRFYFAFGTTQPGVLNDADGDEDVDLADAAGALNCFGSSARPLDPCEFLDSNLDGTVTEWDWSNLATNMTGPTATSPGGYVLADDVRGGQMYDQWWESAGVAEPVGDHPLWSTRPDQAANPRTGAATWRCKECHGWDYIGVDGAYGAGDHRTGFAGILGTSKSPAELFALLKNDPAATANGHAYGTAGLSDRDIWDLVKFSLEGTVDTDAAIDTGMVGNPFIGTAIFGRILYEDTCLNCHGSDGDAIPSAEPEFLGAIANSNPWEFLHNVRFGHPGAPMPPGEILRWAVTDFANIGAYAQSLPQD